MAMAEFRLLSVHPRTVAVRKVTIHKAVMHTYNEVLYMVCYHGDFAWSVGVEMYKIESGQSSARLP